MTKLRSRSLATHFRSLFTGGTLTGLGEGELLDRFISRRDEAAFEELVARHGPMVLAVCRRWLDDPHDLEDAFQATFLILVRKAKALRNREALAPWLHGVSHRVARRAGAAIRRRRERESRAITEPSITTPASTTMNPQDELARREVLALVDDEILRLPEKQRAAAVLCLVQGLSHEAAARALGWPLGTFKSRVAGRPRDPSAAWLGEDWHRRQWPRSAGSPPISPVASCPRNCRAGPSTRLSASSPIRR